MSERKIKSTSIMVIIALLCVTAATSKTLEPEIEWKKTFGGPIGSDHNYGRSIQQTSDGGYIIAGSTYHDGLEDSDVYLTKTDSNGDKLWEKTFGGNDIDVGHSVQQTSDGGYIIVGLIRSYGAGYADVYLIKTNSNGDKLWEKTCGGSSTDCGYSVQQASDGGYIIVGYTWSY